MHLRHQCMFRNHRMGLTCIRWYPRHSLLQHNRQDNGIHMNWTRPHIHGRYMGLRRIHQFAHHRAHLWSRQDIHTWRNCHCSDIFHSRTDWSRIRQYLKRKVTHIILDLFFKKWLYSKNLLFSLTCGSALLFIIFRRFWERIWPCQIVLCQSNLTYLQRLMTMHCIKV